VLNEGKRGGAVLVGVGGGGRGIYRALMGKPEGRKLLGRPRLRWGIILRWICRKWDVGVWTESIWLRIGTGGQHM